jgi:hypothetical protein
MYKPLLLALTLLSTAPLAHAQVRLSVGPQVGYTLSSANYKLSNIDFDNRYRSGFSGGLTAELGVGHLLVRPAVLYAQKGYSQAYSNNGSFGVNFTITSRTRIDYLAVPLNIGYAQRTDGQGFQVFAGAYLGFVLGGHFITPKHNAVRSVHLALLPKLLLDPSSGMAMLPTATAVSFALQTLACKAALAIAIRTCWRRQNTAWGSKT